MTTPRIASSRPLRRLAILLGTLAAVAVPASAADATVYCVHYPDCPAAGVAKDTLQDAVVAADSDGAHDTVRVGPGVFASPDSYPVQPVDILGSGIGATEVDNNHGQLTSGIYLKNAGSRVADLNVRLTANRQTGINLDPGASAQNVKVTASHSLTQEIGLAPDTGSDMKSVVVDLGNDLSSEAIHDFGGATLSDSTLTAGLGIGPDSNGTIVRRVTVRATIPLYVIGGTLNIANALLLPHPDDPQSPNFMGAEVKNGNAGENALLNAADVTIVGGGAGIGVEAWSNTSVNTGASTANVQGAIIRGVAHSLYRVGKSITETADLTIDHSAYAASTIGDGNGNGALTQGVGNLTYGPDPNFVNPAAGDYRLRFDSPLLDKGPPTQPLSGDDPDLGGRSRVRDSDGSGGAVRDIGAFEYQRLAPTAAFTVQPAVAHLGQATAFDAAPSSDPDGDPLSFAWTFGDGATGSGGGTSHTFGTPGSYQTILIATDATGLTATATHAASIDAPAPAPAPAPASGAGSASPPALALNGLSQSARSWLERKPISRATRTRRLPVGTTFGFNLSQSARVRFAFTQKLGGRKVSGKCVPQSARNAGKPRCQRTVTAGTLSFAAHVGANRVRFQGRVSSGKKLKPGRYTLAATATNTAGQRSLPRQLSFTIVKP
jgi:hypothetical protein